MINITTPLTEDVRKKLKAGDEVLLTGTILTARDAAHKRLCEYLEKGKALPLNLKDAVIYYCGPTPAKPGKPIGSCGPTTSSRMDPFTPQLIKLGLGGMIGKGDRSKEVVAAIKKYKCVYFIATGGAGALLSTKVKASKAILFNDLGPEAVYKLDVKDFPLIVGIDSEGRNVYDKAGWKKK
jgi:fumarate hydratase subunit beta